MQEKIERIRTEARELCYVRILKMLQDPNTGNADVLKAVSLFLDHMNGPEADTGPESDMVIAWREESG